MPIVTKDAKVLVTGANGFLAAWTVEFLLKAGYRVRATVRSEVKATPLRTKYAGYGEMFEIVLVPDMAVDGAYDKAVKDIDAIEHIATLADFTQDNPQDYIDAALKGTVGILQSALKAGGGRIRRIVVTSSAGAILGDHGDEPRTYSEHDWNTQSADEVKHKGWGATNVHKYKHSKVLAERAAWEFYETHKSSGTISWDLTILVPSGIFGPFIYDVPDVASLNTSSGFFYKYAVKRVLLPGNPLKTGSSWADVRDIAEAHVRALETEAAGGERIIVSAGPFIWNDWVETIESLNEDNPTGPATSVQPQYLTILDSSKATRILGQTYRTKRETANDILAQFKSRGW